MQLLCCCVDVCEFLRFKYFPRFLRIGGVAINGLSGKVDRVGVVASRFSLRRMAEKVCVDFDPSSHGQLCWEFLRVAVDSSAFALRKSRVRISDNAPGREHDRERKPDFDLSGVEQGVLREPGLDVVGECEITSLKPSNAAESGDACEMDLLQLEEGCKFAL